MSFVRISNVASGVCSELLPDGSCCEAQFHGTEGAIKLKYKLHMKTVHPELPIIMQQIPHHKLKTGKTIKHCHAVLVNKNKQLFNEGLLQSTFQDEIKKLTRA